MGLQRKYHLWSPALGERGTHNAWFQNLVTLLSNHPMKAWILKTFPCHCHHVSQCVWAQSDQRWVVQFLNFCVDERHLVLPQPTNKVFWVKRKKIAHGWPSLGVWEWTKCKLMKDNDFMASATAEEFLVKTGISESVSRVDLASSWCHGYPKFRLIFPFEFLVVLFCLPLLIVGGGE